MRRLRRRTPDPCGRPPDKSSRSSADAAAHMGSSWLGREPRVRSCGALARPMGRPRLAPRNCSRVWRAAARWRSSGQGAAARRRWRRATTGCGSTVLAACGRASLQSVDPSQGRLAEKRLGPPRSVSRHAHRIPPSRLGAAKRRPVLTIFSEHPLPRRGSFGRTRGEAVPWAEPAAGRSELAASTPARWKPSPAAASALQNECLSGGRPQGSGMRRRRRRRSRSPRIGSRTDTRSAEPERGQLRSTVVRAPSLTAGTFCSWPSGQVIRRSTVAFSAAGPKPKCAAASLAER